MSFATFSFWTFDLKSVNVKIIWTTFSQNLNLLLPTKLPLQAHKLPIVVGGRRGPLAESIGLHKFPICR